MEITISLKITLLFIEEKGKEFIYGKKYIFI